MLSAESCIRTGTSSTTAVLGRTLSIWECICDLKTGFNVDVTHPQSLNCNSQIKIKPLMRLCVVFIYPTYIFCYRNKYGGLWYTISDLIIDTPDHLCKEKILNFKIWHTCTFTTNELTTFYNFICNHEPHKLLKRLLISPINMLLHCSTLLCLCSRCSLILKCCPQFTCKPPTYSLRSNSGDFFHNIPNRARPTMNTLA